MKRNEMLKRVEWYQGHNHVDSGPSRGICPGQIETEIKGEKEKRKGKRNLEKKRCKRNVQKKL